MDFMQATHSILLVLSLIPVKSVFVKLISILVCAFPAALGTSLAQAPNSAWVYPSATGNLLYQHDERGQRITDFSQCGYRGGTEPLPNVAAVIPESRWVRVSPGAGDDTALIQAAIDSVEAMTPDANGWRGVVYLNAGEYQFADTITINAGGVVLKGAGDDPASGTRLRATAARQYTLVSVSGSGGRGVVSGTTHHLTQKIVPAGTRSFEVDDTSGLAVGHTVIVKRPSTANWIADIDMDQLGPGSGGDPDDVPWTAGSKDLYFDRAITRIEGNRITVDVPLPQTFESRYGGGEISRYTWSGRIQQVGIEDIYGFSDYAGSTDENHAWTFIRLANLQQGWVRNITAQYFGFAAVSVGDGAKWLTVADSQCLDPISIIDGGRRYSFNNDGAECTLFVNNYARKGRHDFVFGSTVPGPNAFVQCTADTAYSDTGPHHRWSVGGLFDLVTINGNEINVQNRGNLGTGHGWAGAYMAVWNSKANAFRVRNPPTARNWLVGSIGTIGASQYPVGADPPGTYDSSGPSGTGKAVYPRSLYYGQLQQRMKWPDSEFREVWLGDVDQHTNDGANDTVNCNSAWLAQVEAIGSPQANADFDSLVGDRHTACSLDFSLDPGDTIVAASLTVSLRGIGNADSDSIWLDSTADQRTYASLGWTPISTTGPTVRTMEVSPELLADGRLNLAFGTNSAVDFVVLHLQVRKAQPPTHTIMLTPDADAYVRGGTYANNNYGNDPSLQTKDISASNVNREAFLRWDLSGVSGKIVQATVRLAGTTTSQPGNESCATIVSDDSWGETTLTFNNKPSAGKLFAQWLPVAGQPVEFIVTQQVTETLLGDGKLSLRLASTDNFGSAGNVTYASRENPTVANRPQLILTLEDAAPTITSVPDQTVNENTATPALPVILGDDHTDVASLTLTGTSSNPTLLPDANIVFGGSGANRTVTLTPASNQKGTSTITLTVSNGTLNTSTTFLLTVTGVSSTAMIKAATGDQLHLGAAWAGGIAPVLPDTATWNATSLTGTMTLGANLAWGGIIITNPAAPITLNGTQTLTLGSAGIDLSAATVNLTLNHPMVLGENQQWNVVAGRTLAANGIVSGPGSLMKSGNGSLILSAANTYAGATTITAGNLVLGNATNTLPDTTPVSLGAATLSAGAGCSDTIGTLDVTNATSTINLGDATSALNFSNSSAVDWTGGSLNITGAFVSGVSIKFGIGGLTAAQLARISAPGWISFALNGSGFLTATMVRTWDGSDSNSWGEVNNWSGNTQPASIDGALFTSTSASGYNIHLGSAERTIRNMIFDASTATNPYTVHLSDGVTDPVTTARTLTITGSGGGINVDAGTHTIKGRKPGSGTLGDFIMGNGIAFNIASGAALTLDTRLRSSSSGNNFSKTGDGTLVLNADNGGSSGWTHAGFTVSQGVLRFAAVNATGNTGNKFVVSSGAAMELTGSVTLTVNNGTITLNGSGVGSNGALRSVSGSNTISGTGTGGIVLASDTSIGVDASMLSINQVISGSSSLTKVGAGTLALAKANTYGGDTIVNEGTLALSGSLAGPLSVNAGIFAPQGLPVANGSVALNEGSTLQARINGPIAGTQYDQLSAGGSVTLGGALDLAAGPGLVEGTTFIILNKTNAGAVSGTFADRAEGSLFKEDGYTWLITYLGGDGNDIVLTLVPANTTPTYGSWIDGFFPGETNPAIIGANADPDNDGIANAIEMVLGGNPKLVMDSALLPALERVTDPAGIPAGNYLLFTYRRSSLSVAAGVTAECETNAVLATPWTSAAAIPGAVIQVDENFTFTPPAATTTDRVRVYVPGELIPMRFFRLKVNIP